MNAEKLAFVVHVGDIGSSTQAQACSDAWLLARKKQFARIRHPFVLIPGDNEWCELQPAFERLRALARALLPGRNHPRLSRQAGNTASTFAGKPAAGCSSRSMSRGTKTTCGNPEAAPRMKAVLAWLDEAAALAENAKGLVVLMQANPFLTVPATASAR